MKTFYLVNSHVWKTLEMIGEWGADSMRYLWSAIECLVIFTVVGSVMLLFMPIWFLIGAFFLGIKATKTLVEKLRKNETA